MRPVAASANRARVAPRLRASLRPAMDLPELRLKPNEDRRLRAGHLWVYSNEVDIAKTPLGGIEPGFVPDQHPDALVEGWRNR